MTRPSIVKEIARLQNLPVADLQAEWLKLYGEPTRSRNRHYLWKRLAWRLQEIEYGGLSAEAHQRIDEMAEDGFRRARTPAQVTPATPRPRRDPRLPAPGTVIQKRYKGRDLRVVVRDDGLELDGTMYPTATALAKAVTGSRSINGWLFLGVKRRRS